MNLVCIDGRLTRDTEVKMFEDNDKRVIKFSIANQRDKEHSDFINCVAWDNNAEFIHKYFKKGDGINLTGELRQNTYQDKDGNNKSEIYVLVRQAGFPLQKPKESGQAIENDTKIDDSKIQDTNFDQWNAGKEITIDPDELPFY